MIIHHRGIYPDRFDTPFGVGTLIWALDCHHPCKGCFHQDRRYMEIHEVDEHTLIQSIKANPFTNGIILGGYEWTEQYDELLVLISEARLHDLEVILYTHYTKEEILSNYKELLKFKGMYIKSGEYDDTKLSSNYTSYGVLLASTNQVIYKVGDDLV